MCDFMEVIRVEVAKNPVRRGRMGWDIWRFVEQMPMMPERMRIRKGRVFLCSL